MNKKLHTKKRCGWVQYRQNWSSNTFSLDIEQMLWIGQVKCCISWPVVDLLTELISVLKSWCLCVCVCVWFDLTWLSMDPSRVELVSWIKTEREKKPRNTHGTATPRNGSKKKLRQQKIKFVFDSFLIYVSCATIPWAVKLDICWKPSNTNLSS